MRIRTFVITAIISITGVCYGQSRPQEESPRADQAEMGRTGHLTSLEAKELQQLSAQYGQVVPNPERYNPEHLATVNELHDYQIKDLQTRVGNLESARSYGVGVLVGVGGLLVILGWMRRHIVKVFVNEAFPHVSDF